MSVNHKWFNQCRQSVSHARKWQINTNHINCLQSSNSMIQTNQRINKLMSQVDQVRMFCVILHKTWQFRRKIAFPIQLMGCGMRNEDSVRCRALAKTLPLDGQRMNHSRRERSMEGKRDAVMCSFHGWLPFSLPLPLLPLLLSLSLPSALLGGWVTRRKCLGSASVGLKTRCVAWRWWGRDATETKYKPTYRDTSEDRRQ